MLVIGSDDKKLSRYIGRNVFLIIDDEHWHKKYSHDSRYGDNEYKLLCTGRFKKSIKIKLYEMNFISDFFFAQGTFFDADTCAAVKTTDIEENLIDSFLELETN